MTCAYMPEGSIFNGEQNILSDEQVSRLKVGDPLNDNQQNPLIFLR
jgi:phytanoyl-CoA hydroxylase